MFNDYETKKFTDLVDPSSSPVYTYAKHIGQSSYDAYVSLSDAFDKAVADKTINCDDDGWSFETEFATILLVRNQDYFSRYERYMRFDMKQVDLLGACESAEEGKLPAYFGEIYLPTSNIERLTKFIGAPITLESITSALDESYAEAYAKKLFTVHKGSFNFDTSLKTASGETIYVGIKPVSPTADGKIWLLNFVGYRTSMNGVYFSSAIEEFADIKDDKYLSELAALARPEKWYFGDDIKNLEILKNYITYTFYKLQCEEKICVSADGNFAAFNTGLASSSYDDIYMCFTKDDADSRLHYAGVCVAAIGPLGKQLVSMFNPLPASAEYITCKEDILYDMSKQLFVDAEHILMDRLHRIPAKFLEMYLQGCPKAKELIDEAKMCDESEREAICAELADVVAEDAYASSILKSALESVVSKTLKMLRWNYRMAIPSYFPKGNAMSLLLPMDFTGEGAPQAALVVKLTESGNYIGHTILSMKYAYLNARLISSQESSWLTA